MSCNSPGTEELKGRSCRGGVAAQTEWRTVLFVILPKVYNWKKKLWPVRNPGCGRQCFLGWGKRVSRPVSCLGHGWTNMWSLAEKWLWWEIFWMYSYLMIFRITQVLLSKISEKSFLRATGIILCNKSCWCFGTSKILLRRFTCSKTYKAQPSMAESIDEVTHHWLTCENPNKWRQYSLKDSRSEAS